MNDYDPKMIGKRIKETAQSKGYTAEKLSEITGNGIHTINRECPKVCVNLQTDVR